VNTPNNSIAPNPSGVKELVIWVRVFIEPTKVAPEMPRARMGIGMRLLARLWRAKTEAAMEEVRKAVNPPPYNRIGTHLLARLLQAKMDATGAEVRKASRAFEFNRSYYTFIVGNLHPALVAIKAELNELDLLEGSQIAWCDPRENVIRLVHSKTTEFQFPSAAEMEMEGKVMARLTELLNKASRQKDDNAGQ
jgi:hypothetical protein